MALNFKNPFGNRGRYKNLDGEKNIGKFAHKDSVDDNITEEEKKELEEMKFQAKNEQREKEEKLKAYLIQEDSVLSDSELKEKGTENIGNIGEALKNLRELLPDFPDIVYEFGEYFADKIGKEALYSQGYDMKLLLVLGDLQRGEDGFTSSPTHKQKIDNPLKQQLDKDPKGYNLLLFIFQNQVKNLLLRRNIFLNDIDNLNEKIKESIRETEEESNKGLEEKKGLLTYPDFVVIHMLHSQNQEEWNKRANEVKKANGGEYPSFWFKKIIMGGVLDELEELWKENAT